MKVNWAIENFFCKSLRKLPERTVAQYHHWIFEHKKEKNVETFRSFIIQEAEFKKAPYEKSSLTTFKEGKQQNQK